MPKITFMGAGSSVFAKNILGDSMLSPALHDAHIALYDIDSKRLRESKRMLQFLNKNINKGRAKIWPATDDRRYDRDRRDLSRAQNGTGYDGVCSRYGEGVS